MLIGLLSDTHDRLTTMRAALGCFSDLGIKTIAHAGDLVAPFAARLLVDYGGQVYVTFGNNDGERRGLLEVLPAIQNGPLKFEAGGQRILLHHYVEWCHADDIERADVIVTGHTHRPIAERRNGKLFINPGECCGWLSGRCTAAVLNLADCSVEHIEVSP
ncbi:MAG: metallophosphoesterase [Planctomycetota bacterium]